MTAQDDRTTELLGRALDYTIRIRDDNPTVLHKQDRETAVKHQRERCSYQPQSNPAEGTLA